MCILCCSCGAGLRQSRKVDVSRLPVSVLPAKLADDFRTLRLLAERLDSLQPVMETLLAECRPQPQQPLTLDQRDALKSSWALLLDATYALQSLAVGYDRFYKLPDSLRCDAFLTGYCAYLLLYARGLEFIQQTQGVPHFEVLLDDSIPEYGVPRGQYAALKYRILHIADVTRILAGYQAYQYYAGQQQRATWTGDRLRLAVSIEENYAVCRKGLVDNGGAPLGKNAVDIMRDQALQLAIPAQAAFAGFLGETRATRRTQALISREQCQQLAQRARPGDIVLERKEWFLSNLGIPGFWTHAALYLGAPDELAQWADTLGVAAFYRLRDSTCTGFTAYLQKKYPDAWQQYRQGRNGLPYRLMEGLAPGIVLTAVEKSAGHADHAAVLRPRLSKLDVAQAIELAFHYWGRAYDFNFDFLSDQSLVCSELVYKCYEPRVGKNGLAFRLERVSGHLLLPPNAIAAQFDRECAEIPQFDFILFLDGDETTGAAREEDVAAFRTSWQRPGWRFYNK